MSLKRTAILLALKDETGLLTRSKTIFKAAKALNEETYDETVYQVELDNLIGYGCVREVSLGEVEITNKGRQEMVNNCAKIREFGEFIGNQFLGRMAFKIEANAD
jgi:hypothetical protein